MDELHNRRYDNYILYDRMLGKSNEERIHSKELYGGDIFERKTKAGSNQIRKDSDQTISS